MQDLVPPDVKARLQANPSLEYFYDEWCVASDSANPFFLLPTIPPGARVLNVGCGGGWPNQAAGVESFTACDIDDDAVLAHRLLHPDSRCDKASGEALPYEDGEFTFLLARVSIPYMHLHRFFAEAARVLAPGGEVWLSCHDFAHVRNHLMRSVRNLHVKDIVFRSYVMLNGFALHVLGKQFDFPGLGRTETFQTQKALRRELGLAGFGEVEFMHNETHMLVTARKTGRA